MAKRRKKTAKKAGHRKNPKRVAAGRKAARARWGKTAVKKTRRKKASKKASKKGRISTVKFGRAIVGVLLQK